MPWPPERMRRVIFSLSCSSSKAANVPKPVSFGIASSQIRIAFDCHAVDEMQSVCICGPPRYAKLRNLILCAKPWSKRSVTVGQWLGNARSRRAAYPKLPGSCLCPVPLQQGRTGRGWSGVRGYRFCAHLGDSLRPKVTGVPSPMSKSRTFSRVSTNLSVSSCGPFHFNASTKAYGPATCRWSSPPFWSSSSIRRVR
jgi:hypothetical protein